MNDYTIENWETEVSSCQRLYFVELIHRDVVLQLRVEDDNGKGYSVEIENPGPYRVYDEQYLVDYWGRDDRKGWTFIVDGSQWDRLHVELLEVYQPGMKHYVIATLDYCLEVLARNEPTIRVLSSNSS